MPLRLGECTTPKNFKKSADIEGVGTENERGSRASKRESEADGTNRTEGEATSWGRKKAVQREKTKDQAEGKRGARQREGGVMRIDEREGAHELVGGRRQCLSRTEMANSERDAHVHQSGSRMEPKVHYERRKNPRSAKNKTKH